MGSFLIRKNKDILTKFATRADSAVLKKLKVKPLLVPEQLFELPLVVENNLSGKRKSKPTEKLRESETNESHQSPKKTKTDGKGDFSAKEKKKETETKKSLSSKIEKKNQDVTELHSSVLMSAMTDQFADQQVRESLEMENPIENPPSKNTTLLETWDLCTGALSTSEKQHLNKIPVPSQEVLTFLKGFSKPGVIDFMKKIANHFDNDEGCRHANNECFEIDGGDGNTWGSSEPDIGNNDYQYVITDLSYQPEQQLSEAIPNFTSTSGYSNRFPQIVAPLEIENTQLSHPLVSGTDIQHTEYVTATKMARPAAPELKHMPTVCTSPPSSPSIISGSVNQYKINSPKMKTVTTPGNLVSPSKNDSRTVTELNSPLRRSPRKNTLPVCSSPDDADPQDRLLKKFPDVKIQPGRLTAAISAARKSSKPGYTLCYNLIESVCTTEELACSRGQGLTKRREGDFRPDLDKNKCIAVKEYTIRWCKKYDKALPSAAEMNNAITEQISHCRKKYKKMKDN